MKSKIGKFDVVLIFALVIIIAAGGYYYFSKRKTAAEAQRVLIEFDVLATDLSLDEAQSFKDGEGTEVIFGKTNIDKGKLKSVKIEPFRLLTIDTINGERQWEALPSRHQVILTIEKAVSETDDMFMGDKEEIRIGELMPVKGKGFGSSDGYVTDLKAMGD